MDQDRRSYFLPKKLVAALDQEADRCGHFRETTVAAAMAHFVHSPPDARAQMFEELDRFLRGQAK